MIRTKEMAGSVTALAGHGDAKAASPTSDSNSVEQLTLEGIEGAERPETNEISEYGAGERQSGTIDVSDLLDRVEAFLLRFVRLPSEAASVAVVLWAAHAHLMDAWDSTPRLAFLSAEPGSGKSRAMDITALFVPLALESSNASTAALIRATTDPAGTPTYFIDEIDAKYGPGAKGDEDLRSMINAGHKRGGYFLRCEMLNDTWVPVKRSAYAAMAMAGIGDLPDTILTRSVIIRMRKRAPHEEVESYRQRNHKGQGHALRDELAAWAAAIADKAADCRPVLPDQIADRNADVWEPLIAVADLVGGAWPSRAREAALQLLAAAKSGTQPSPGVQLLADIHKCFRDEDRLTTKELLIRLLVDEEAPWGDFRGKKLDPRKLGELLRPFGISSCGLRLPDGSTPKGYKREAFHDAWTRYPPNSGATATSATTATAAEPPLKMEDVSPANETVWPPRGGRGGDVAESESP